MSETWEIQLPDDASERLEELSEDRVNEVVAEAVREALDLVESAEERREELHQQRRGMGRGVEELE